MPTTAISAPKQWEDYVSLALGLWLITSPQVVESSDVTVSLNAVLVGFLLIAVESVTISAFRVWEEWMNVALGAWLVISPWVLGAALGPAVNFVGVGVVVLVLALYEIWDMRWHSAHPA